MADYSIFKKDIFENEGSYSNHKADTGKRTIYGITEKWFPEEFNKIYKLYVEGKEVLAKEEAEEFYKEKFWVPMGCNTIDSQYLANQLCDIAINSGVNKAKEMGLEAFKLIYPNIFISKYDTYLLTLLNKIPKQQQNEVNNALINLRILFYKDIVEKKPDQKVFLKGWLNRAKKYLI